MFDVRIATPEDAPVFSLLSRITFQENLRSYFPNREELNAFFDQEYDVASIEQQIINPNTIHWMVFYKRIPIGFLILKVDSPLKIEPEKSACEIHRMFVIKDFVHTGAGLALYRAMEEKLKEIKPEIIWVSILEDNELAQNFFNKQGFELQINHLFSVSRYNLKFQIYRKYLHWN